MKIIPAQTIPAKIKMSFILINFCINKYICQIYIFVL